MKPITVLVTACGNVYMRGLTDCLKHNGERSIRIVGADMNRDASILQMADVCYQVPRADSPDYVDRLLDICRKERVDVLLPIMSAELDEIARRRDAFACIGTRVSISDAAALAVANDKLALFERMRQSGIPVPRYAPIHSMEGLETAMRALGYPDQPVVIKVTNSSGSRGTRIIDAHFSAYDIFLHEKPNSYYMTLDALRDMLRTADRLSPMLAMEYLPGTEYTVDMVAGRGRVLYGGCRRGLNVQTSIILDAVIEDKPDIMALCASVVEELKLDGCIGFDIRERADGTPCIMECNPRATAGVSAFLYAGLNLPYLCVKYLMGEELPEQKLRYGTVVRRRWQEMPVAPEEAAKQGADGSLGERGGTDA